MPRMCMCKSSSYEALNEPHRCEPGSLCAILKCWLVILALAFLYPSVIAPCVATTIDGNDAQLASIFSSQFGAPGAAPTGTSLASPGTAAQSTPGQDCSWIPVPDWLGGTWRSESQVVFYSFDYAQQRYTIDRPTTIAIDRVRTIGCQRDSGQIWHYTGVPYLRTTNTPTYIERQKIERIWLRHYGSSEISIQTLATVVQIDRGTGQIRDSFRELTDTTYEPISDGVVQVTFFVNDYDLVGRLKSSSKSLSMEKRIKPYRQIDQDDRGDLRQLFVGFIRNTLR